MSSTSSSTPYQGLLAATAALRSGPDLRLALDAVVHSVCESLGYDTAALNLYRPATDEFVVETVHGAAGARDTLLGTASEAQAWAPLLDSGLERHGCFWVPEGALDLDEDRVTTWVPPLADPVDPEAWRAEDALFVVLRGVEGTVLGILSLDEPRSGRRPTDAQLDVLSAVAFQAGLVIESAQGAQLASAHRAAVQELLAVGGRIMAAASAEQVAHVVCAGIRDALGFDRVVVMLRDDADRLALAAEVGGHADEAIGPWPIADLQALLDTVDPDHGCALLPLDVAESLVPESMHGAHPSVNNGRGPHGWDRHWLMVPLVGEDGSLLGFIWPDDPRDRRLPPVERLQTLRAFANQASVALEARRATDQLAHLTRHDPLTGLRNRRGLTEQIDAVLAARGDTPATVVLADADAFKRVNDELGYHTGDEALRVIAAGIGTVLADGAVGARLGGEEFALVLPAGGERAARTAAEALRREVGRSTVVPWGLRLSVGIATARDGEDAETLLRQASRALTAAKRLGRDRVVAYDPATIEPLLQALGRDDDRRTGHLAAVMLLAETLDLRDEGTARHSRTVGRYTEALARRMGLTEERVERVRVAGLLHDVGKLAIPDRILHKPGLLTEAEWREVRAHPETGARIVANAGLRDVAEWVLAHHEHWDGRGYPLGLEGAAIPLESRILAVADAYEAMTAVRPYRPRPPGPAAARAELRACAGTQFDPEVVAAFLALLT